ncbi:hypothetical protein KKH27_11930 [bacterium]|nr:hypothetical protein [bacterium]MBU1983842.1 hypothetical protein [bacterium]
MQRTICTMLMFLPLVLFVSACDEGIDDWNSSAKISGYVFADPGHTRGVEGVQVILESDPDADNPYEGPDRWVTTDANGYFEGHVFLGNQSGEYNYIADLSAGYFWRSKAFSWGGGITVSPGSHFTLPPVDTTMFVPVVSGG